MFSVNPFIWIGICVALIVLSCVYYKKYNPTLEEVVNVAFCFALYPLSQKTIKSFSLMDKWLFYFVRECI